MHCRTAILLFSRTPEEEVLYKPLPEGEHVHRALLRHTMKVCDGMQAVLIPWHQEQQVGSTFGDRLDHAISQVWQQGFSSILVVGADTPGLTKAVLRNALVHLEEGSQLIGPSPDGGCYMIGLQRRAYRSELFKSLSWNTCHLLGELKALLENASILGCLRDIDSEKDLMLYLNSGQTSTLQLELRELISKKRKQEVPHQLIIHPAEFLKSSAIRGSPARLTI